MKGVLVAAAVALALLSTTTPGAAASVSSSRTVKRLVAVGHVSDAVRREVAGVRNVRDVQRLSVRAQRRVRTPVVEVTEYRKVPETVDTYGSGRGRVKRGCYRVWVTRTRKNVFGWTLITAKTTIRNWCNNGKRITSSPTVTRSLKGQWGWSACGWADSYSGWLRGRARYGAGGYGQFAYADSCFVPQAQLRNELQVQGDGRWFWWN